MTEILGQAMACHRAGSLERAQALYQTILQTVPDDFPATHMLGVVHFQRGELISAEMLLRQAISLDDGVAEAHYNLGCVLRAADQLSEAKRCFELSLQLNPGFEMARARLDEMQAAAAKSGAIAKKPFGIHLHQIYYSEQTRLEVDHGFIGLDNLANERPDWREYWPIRQYLLRNRLDEDDYYGFFSPKFKDKTRLDADQVKKFVSAHAADAQVLIFSPYFDLSAFPLNIFEQGASQHKGTREAFRGSVSLLDSSVDLATLVMDSRNTVFCNFFVAKPEFWAAWLKTCERLFAVAEAGGTALAAELNANTEHDGGGVPAKVFVMERVASLMLSTQHHWKVRAFNPTLLPYSTAKVADYRNELILMDALKIAFATQGHPQFLAAYFQYRQAINAKIKSEGI
jgi:tetratricopeptide (TPR) repeat protein